MDPLATNSKIVARKSTHIQSETAVNLADLPDPVISGQVSTIGNNIVANLEGLYWAVSRFARMSTRLLAQTVTWMRPDQRCGIW